MCHPHYAIKGYSICIFVHVLPYISPRLLRTLHYIRNTYQFFYQFFIEVKSWCNVFIQINVVF